jgi:hypothetical protein
VGSKPRLGKNDHDESVGVPSGAGEGPDSMKGAAALPAPRSSWGTSAAGTSERP